MNVPIKEILTPLQKKQEYAVFSSDSIVK